MPNPTTVATVNHPQPQPSRHPQIADLPFREGPQNYLRAVLKCGGRATNADLASSVGVSTRTIQRRRRRLEADASVCAAGFRVEARFRGKWQITNQITLPPVADRRRCECMSGSESPALGVTDCHPTYVRRKDQDLDQEQKDRARDPATTATTAAVRTGDDSTERDRGPSCAPETSPTTHRTPVKAKPATPPQLDYVAFLADELDVSRPDPSTLTVRSADRVIRNFKTRYARSRARGLAAAREQGTRLDYASTYECHACGGRHYAEPGGLCGGCRQPMRLH